MVGDLNMPALQRQINDQRIKWVAKHPLFQKLKPDIDAGKILPCLRKEEVHLYEHGARLLNFSKGKVLTDSGFAGTFIAGVCGKGSVVLPANLDLDKFECIHNVARTHHDKQPNSELMAVHALFPKFAVTRKKHHCGKLALIDVGIRFGTDETDATTKANMIDLAFLLPDRSILFVEAKCIGNPKGPWTGRQYLSQGAHSDPESLPQNTSGLQKQLLATARTCQCATLGTVV
jgi:hypothetical protein